jgi:hypothetical protein
MTSIRIDRQVQLLPAVAAILDIDAKNNKLWTTLGRCYYSRHPNLRVLISIHRSKKDRFFKLRNPNNRVP